MYSYVQQVIAEILCFDKGKLTSHVPLLYPTNVNVQGLYKITYLLLLQLFGTKSQRL